MICKKCGRDVQPHWEDYCPHFPKRLKRGEGSGALTGFAAAKRAAEPDRAEDRERSDRPQSLAVSPVEAKAAIVFARGALFRKAANHDDRGNDFFETGRDELGEIEEEMAALCRKHAETLWSLLPEPESEQSENAGDGKQSQESSEADVPPSNGTASGRRTIKWSYREKGTKNELLLRLQTGNPPWRATAYMP